jgi:acetyl-CoA acetyltransferase
MTLSNTFIPYGHYWSSAFCRWQGALAGQNSVELVAATAKRFLAERDIDGTHFDSLSLGVTVPQKHSFYGAPWVAGMMGLETITGPTLAQACATSARVIASAAGDLESGTHDCTLALTCDRTSNGPQMFYPNPNGIGGMADVEAWVWDNFNRDEVTLIRHQQYQKSLADDRAFQKRYMFPVEYQMGKKTVSVSEDEGIFPTTAEGLAKLRPVMKEGTVTFGGQTHPADGHAGMVLCSAAKAAELSVNSDVKIQILAFGTARVDKGHMPMAVFPAAEKALANAGMTFGDMNAIKTHNPFAVNDVYLSKMANIPTDKINDYGSPLIYGHPQGPTGMRVIIELIEQLVIEGGGHGLFAGCAAGDTAMALVLKVS